MQCYYLQKGAERQFALHITVAKLPLKCKNCKPIQIIMTICVNINIHYMEWTSVLTVGRLILLTE